MVASWKKVTCSARCRGLLLCQAWPALDQEERPLFALGFKLLPYVDPDGAPDGAPGTGSSSSGARSSKDEDKPVINLDSHEADRDLLLPTPNVTQTVDTRATGTGRWDPSPFEDSALRLIGEALMAEQVVAPPDVVQQEHDRTLAEAES